MSVTTMTRAIEAIPKLITPAKWRLMDRVIDDPLICEELARELGMNKHDLYTEVKLAANSMRALVGVD